MGLSHPAFRVVATALVLASAAIDAPRRVAAMPQEASDLVGRVSPGGLGGPGSRSALRDERPDERPDGSPAFAGGHRIEWDQDAPSASTLSLYGFRLYVEEPGSPFSASDQMLTDVHCGASAEPYTFVCSASLPSLPEGTLYLRIAATRDGVEGPRSEPVVVTNAAVSAASAVDARRPGIAFSPICFSGPPHACFAVQRLAAGPGRWSAPASTPDGRLFIIEDGTRIKVVSGGMLLPEAALITGSPDERLLQVAVDPAFPSSHAVLVLSRDGVVSGDGAVSVTRYRELRNQLAEGAVIIPALRTPAPDDARLVQDATGLVYLTVAGGTREDRPGASLLRFTSDGATPWASGQASPVLARGYAAPTAMTVDPASRRLWIADRDPRTGAVLQWLDAATGAATDAATGVGTGTVQADRAGRGTVPLDSDVVALTIANPATGATGRYLVSIDANGAVARRRVDDGTRKVGEPQPLDFPYGTVVAVTGAPDGSLYLVAKPLVPGVSGSVLFALTPVVAAR